MTATPTYNYNPSIGEISLYAFNLCGVRSTSLTAEHMNSVTISMNMLLSKWSNQGVNLWKVNKITVPLAQGTSTYPVDPSVVMVLDAYVTTTNSGTNVDRIIMPISRTEYASYPNKAQQGFTTVYWFDRLISPTITIWPVPDGSGNPATLTYYYVTQVGDASIPSGATPDIPYRWLDAFATGLAYYLSRIWSPDKAMLLKSEAAEAYQVAAVQDTENVSIYISPMISGYFR